jgi:hypothetical protein
VFSKSRAFCPPPPQGKCRRLHLRPDAIVSLDDVHAQQLFEGSDYRIETTVLAHFDDFALGPAKMTAQYYDVRTLVEEEFRRRHDCAQAGVVRGDPVVLRQWHVEVDAHKHILPPQVHTFGETCDVSRRLIASPPVGRACANSRILTGIVGDVGSRSDGGGGDVNPDARGRTRDRTVANGGIDDDDPAAATRSDDAASSMLEREAH